MKIDLNSQEKSGLESRHKKARDSRESDRIKAVLLSSEGWSVFQISGTGLRLFYKNNNH